MPATAFETIVTDLTLPEGLYADEEGGLFFSDVLEGGIYRWSPSKGVETILTGRRGVGGLLAHADGGLVLGGRELTHVDGERSRRLLGNDGSFLGVNDIEADAAGGIFAGTLRRRWDRLDSGEVGQLLHLSAAAVPTVAIDKVGFANGIAIAADGSHVYVSDSQRHRVREVSYADGLPVAERTLVDLEVGHPDGLALDAEGAVWVATAEKGSFDRYDVGGSLIDQISAPDAYAVTLCFGGEDRRDLFLSTANLAAGPTSRAGAIHRIRTDFVGVPRLPARI